MILPVITKSYFQDEIRQNSNQVDHLEFSLGFC